MKVGPSSSRFRVRARLRTRPRLAPDSAPRSQSPAASSPALAPPDLPFTNRVLVRRLPFEHGSITTRAQQVPSRLFGGQIRRDCVEEVHQLAAPAAPTRHGSAPSVRAATRTTDDQAAAGHVFLGRNRACTHHDGTTRADPPARAGALLTSRVVRLHGVLELAVGRNHGRRVPATLVKDAVEKAAMVEEEAHAIDPQPGSV